MNRNIDIDAIGFFLLKKGSLSKIFHLITEIQPVLSFIELSQILEKCLNSVKIRPPCNDLRKELPIKEQGKATMFRNSSNYHWIRTFRFGYKRRGN